MPGMSDVKIYLLVFPPLFVHFLFISRSYKLLFLFKFLLLLLMFTLESEIVFVSGVPIICKIKATILFLLLILFRSGVFLFYI